MRRPRASADLSLSVQGDGHALNARRFGAADRSDGPCDHGGGVERRDGVDGDPFRHLGCEQLGCDQRPRGVLIAPVTADAMQARRHSRHHERPHVDGLLAQHHGKQRHIAAQPIPRDVRGDQVRAHHDGEGRTVLTRDH
ncbi:hypothetical protein L3i23_22220 [Herbiconiux sp. L3-i23]|nr:hypothetical protein L3i23_22220 [Herbiconiux sp. L3-i23]